MAIESNSERYLGIIQIHNRQVIIFADDPEVLEAKIRETQNKVSSSGYPEYKWDGKIKRFGGLYPIIDSDKS